MSAGKLVSTVIGALVALVGLLAVAGGVALLVVHTTQRDADGFFETPTYRVDSTSSAIATRDADLVGARPGDWFPAEGDLTVRITATSSREVPVFIGIADSDAVDTYLAGVDHDRITELGRTSADIAFEPVPGGPLTDPPTEQDLWVAQATGTGRQTLVWDLAPGAWTLVLANADGSAGISAQLAGAIRAPVLLPIGVGLVVGGLLVLAVGAVLVLVGVSRRGTDVAPRELVGTPTGGASPVRLEGRLDPDLSRGLWLVKWFLAIPHLVVLAFLWVAFVVMTAVAGFAILFTGRYPRGIFDFNVGVLRWTWRVSYYAFGALGTDRYPPFSLDHDPDYPATLEVAYPEHLSRGLVLVKWWLLALPHYLIVGVLTGGLLTWTLDLGGPDGGQVVLGGGLIGVLVIVSGLALAFSGRYPQGLFDLVVGLQRWVYRVTAYAGLLTDTYPPFRLDSGGTEPPNAPTDPPGPAPASGGAERELAHH